ncbi:NlpC/P60 family protein [Brevundimonas lutea]|uniref:C40 family peptidase n=1 Tax=Brevundimonas lutea TaxID=2293980 RepID=UPI001F0C820D|nr:NlpC/P60 family protein [Brevundimonas lutea]
MIRPADIDDPRLRPAHGDLADQRLEGLWRAPAYRTGRPMRVTAPTLDLVDADGRRQTQLLFGETFEALVIEGGRAFGRCARDGYVGWVEAAALSVERLEPTHRVATADGDLPLNALVRIEPGEPAEGLADLFAFDDDPAAVAERFLGAPYAWGGRTRQGIDCSGLVQAALFACGLGCPRDADMQARELGHETSDAPRRNDLACLDGHIGLMLDAERLIHADGKAGAVVVMLLADVEAIRGPARLRRL